MTAKSPGQQPAQFGVIGLGVMGANLALNVEDHGYSVVVWNHTEAKVEDFLEQQGTNRWVLGAKTLGDFARALAPPRSILLMVKAGDPVDDMLERLAPHLAPGDVLIDGGNSFFRDTQRREAALRGRGVSFVGMGVSGGEAGARHGPSLMPGGPRAAYDHLRPILEAIAAKTDSGPCVTYVGPDGAGHFTKMVHNGIEYGVMQIIAEAYDLLRRVVGLSAAAAADVFAEWGRGPLDSYLIQITSQVLAARDPETGQPLVDLILDRAGQKGTGVWTAQVALELGVPIPTVTAAVEARALSSLKPERVRASALFAGGGAGAGAGREDANPIIDAIRDAVWAATLCAYAQGMSLLRAASAEHAWNIDLREIARIWKGGCIIRARLLDPIMRAFERAPGLANLLLDPELGARVRESERGWRRTVQTAVERGIAIPALAASLAYFDGYRTARLPQNLIQAQRDFFGAHTYQRVDRPQVGFVHTDWPSLIAQSRPGATA